MNGITCLQMITRSYFINYYMQELFVNIPEDLIVCALRVLLGMSIVNLHKMYIALWLREYLREYLYNQTYILCR